MSRDVGGRLRRCVACGDEFTAVRANAKYCGERCRQRGHRSPATGESSTADASVFQLPSAANEGAIRAATRAELAKAGRADSALGHAALLAAQRLDSLGPMETGSGVKALIEAHRTALAEALRDAKEASDPLEDIRRSAALKLLESAG